MAIDHRPQALASLRSDPEDSGVVDGRLEDGCLKRLDLYRAMLKDSQCAHTLATKVLAGQPHLEYLDLGECELKVVAPTVRVPCTLYSYLVVCMGSRVLRQPQQSSSRAAAETTTTTTRADSPLFCLHRRP